MSYDVKLFCACNHVVDGQYYELQLCPRCYGTGYYYDIYFDRQGDAVLTTGSVKLEQEILKVIIDKKGKNIFHPLWGSDIDGIIGTKNLNLNQSKAEMLVRTALEHLKSIQINEYMTYKNLTSEEILNNIEYIKVTLLGPTAYNIDVKITNQQGRIISQTVTI